MIKTKTKLPFTQEELEKNLIHFARILKRRAENDWDAVVCISGQEGSSKSVGAYWIASQIDKKFDFERNELFSVKFEDILAKITDPKIKVIVGDEAIKWLYKRHWATRGQIFINQLYTLCRKENKITLLCIPRFGDLNEYFRNHRVKFWVYVVARGLAIVFSRDWSPFRIKDPWFLDENQKVVDRMRYWKNLDLRKKIKAMSRCRGFMMAIGYPDFPDDIKARYKEVKNKYVYEGEVKKDLKESIVDKKVEIEKTKDKIRFIKLIKYLKEMKGMSFKEMAHHIGESDQTISKIYWEGRGADSFLEKNKKVNTVNSGE